MLAGEHTTTASRVCPATTSQINTLFHIVIVGFVTRSTLDVVNSSSQMENPDESEMPLSRRWTVMVANAAHSAATAIKANPTDCP